MKNTKQTDISKYCSYLEDVKWRATAIERILDGTVTHGKEILNYEFCAIQLRKILELIVFSSLIAHKEPYSRAYKKFRKHWNIKKLIENLDQINPAFYPIPMEYKGQNPSTKIKHFENKKVGFLLKEEIPELYDYCGGIVHTRNPFRTGANVLNIRNSVTEWVQRIKNLLSLHRVKLLESDTMWMVTMSNQGDGKVHAFPSAPIET